MLSRSPSSNKLRLPLFLTLSLLTVSLVPSVVSLPLPPEPELPPDPTDAPANGDFEDGSTGWFTVGRPAEIRDGEAVLGSPGCFQHDTTFRAAVATTERYVVAGFRLEYDYVVESAPSDGRADDFLDVFLGGSAGALHVDRLQPRLDGDGCQVVEGHRSVPIHAESHDLVASSATLAQAQLAFILWGDANEIVTRVTIDNVELTPLIQPPGLPR